MVGVKEEILRLKKWQKNVKNQFLEISKILKNNQIIFYSISSVSSNNKINPYTTPIRISENKLIAGCIVGSQIEALIAANYVQNSIDYLLLDVEKMQSDLLDMNETVAQLVIDQEEANEILREFFGSV